MERKRMVKKQFGIKKDLQLGTIMKYRQKRISSFI